MSAVETKDIALTDLLATAFAGDPAGLRRWVRTSLGQQAHHDLPGEVVSFSDLVFQTMLIMKRCGHVNASSFRSLCAARPSLADRVRDVAREWGIEAELALPDAHVELDALGQHTELLRWLYEECPVLGIEPFSLADIYVETDCVASARGARSWQQGSATNASVLPAMMRSARISRSRGLCLSCSAIPSSRTQS